MNARHAIPAARSGRCFLPRRADTGRYHQSPVIGSPAEGRARPRRCRLTLSACAPASTRGGESLYAGIRTRRCFVIGRFVHRNERNRFCIAAGPRRFIAVSISVFSARGPLRASSPNFPKSPAAPLNYRRGESVPLPPTSSSSSSVSLSLSLSLSLSCPGGCIKGFQLMRCSFTSVTLLDGTSRATCSASTRN